MVHLGLPSVLLVFYTALVSGQNVYPNTRIVMVPAEYLQQYQQQLAGRQVGPVQFTNGQQQQQQQQQQQGPQQPRYISIPPIPPAPTPVYDTQYQHVAAQPPPQFPPTQRVAQLLLPSNAERQVQKVAQHVGGQDLAQQVSIAHQQGLANQAIATAQRRTQAQLRRAQQQNAAFQAQVRAAQAAQKQQYLQYDAAPNHSGIPPPPPVPQQLRTAPPQKIQYEFESNPSTASSTASAYQAQLKAAQQAQPQRYVYEVATPEEASQSQHEAAQQQQYLVEVRPQQTQSAPRYQVQQASAQEYERPRQEYEHTRTEYVTQYESEEPKSSGRQQYRPAPQQVSQEEQEPVEEHDTKSSYQFGFDVKDDHNTNYQNRKEQRENGKITGSYSVVDSDGYIRTVTYTADPKEGFKAEVVRKPTDIVVKIPKPEEKQPQEAPQEYYREVPAHLVQKQPNLIYRYQ